MASRLTLCDSIEDLLYIIAQREHMAVSVKLTPFYTGTKWEMSGEVHYEDWVPKLGTRKREFRPFENRARLMRLLKGLARRG